MTEKTTRFALILGLLSCVGPFAIDMYLPAMPLITEDLSTTVAHTQMTLTAFFLAFAFGQFIYGPLADQMGRKPPLYMGLSLFIAASIGCALAPTIDSLIACRFLQGLGAAAVTIIPRAIIRDLSTGTAAARLMATVVLIVSISPMLAPMTGSAIMTYAHWRFIFAVSCFTATLALFLTLFQLPETLAKEARIRINPKNMAKGIRSLLGHKKFMLLTFIGAFGIASFFVFLASASFVYRAQFGLTSNEFGIAFALNAIGFFASSQVAANLGERFGMHRVIAFAVIGFFLFSMSLLGLLNAGFASIYLVVGFLFCGNACLGLVIPSSLIMALDDHGDHAGLASSLGGTLQMLTGSMVVLIAGQFFDGTSLPMVAAITACALACVILSYFALRVEHKSRALEQAE